MVKEKAIHKYSEISYALKEKETTKKGNPVFLRTWINLQNIKLMPNEISQMKDEYYIYQLQDKPAFAESIEAKSGIVSTRG